MVPRAEFSSYYGRPILKKPVWNELDIAGYFFAGGIAAGSAAIAFGGQVTDRDSLRRSGRLAALGFLGAGTVGLIHDLGVPARFHHMMRVAKPTSPMSVGTWILAAFGPPVGVAAMAELVPALRPIGDLAGAAAALVAPAVATYTAVLICDTAIPAWHGAYPEMPFVFAGSALSGAAGLALIAADRADAGPVRVLAVLGPALELAAARRTEHRLGFVGEPYSSGKAGRKMRWAKALTAAGAVGAAIAAGRSRRSAVLSGAALLAASAMTRFAIFEAGVASAADPAYTVRPQRERRSSTSREDAQPQTRP
jgi:DMSO reductase anchor subunit